MDQFKLAIDYITNHDILLFITYVIFSFVCAFIIDKIFIVGLKAIVGRTKTNLDDNLIEVLHPAIYNSIFIASFLC